jgi:DNA-binding CsgD family transcriptional regulator
MTEVAARAGALATPAANPAGLSDREVEVLVLLAAGATNKAIAEALFLSIKTVERHLLNAYRKIGARGRAEATAFALRHHLGEG